MFVFSEATTVPKDVVVVRSPDGLRMNASWTPLSLSQARGFPLYVISYGPLNSLKRAETMQAVTNGSHIIITGLDPLQSYSVSLSVQTLGGSISNNQTVTSASPIASGPSSIVYGQYFCSVHLSGPVCSPHFCSQLSLGLLLPVLLCSQ